MLAILAGVALMFVGVGLRLTQRHGIVSNALNALSLSPNTFTPGQSGTANILGRTAGSTLTLTAADAVYSINSGTGVLSWTTAITGSTAAPPITETKAGVAGSPRTTTPVFGPVSTLNALTFSATSFTIGSSASGTINGATAGSTITASGLPTGVTINGPARTWAYDGSGSGATTSITLTEALAGAPNSPRTTSINLTVAASGAGAPANTAAPVTTFDGTTFSSTNGAWTNGPTGYAIQWRRDSANISGATSATYVKGTADEKTFVDCVVTATNGSGSTAQASNGIPIDPPLTQVALYDCNGITDFTNLTTVYTDLVQTGSSGGDQFQAESNRFRIQPNAGFLLKNTGSPNVRVSVKLLSTYPCPNLIINGVDTANYCNLNPSGNNWYLSCSIAGVVTTDTLFPAQIGTTNVNDVVSLEQVGTTLRLLRNGTQVYTRELWAGVTRNGKAGLASSGGYVACDDLRIEASSAINVLGSATVNNDLAILITGSYAGTAPGGLSMRFWDQFGTLIQDWTALPAPTIGGGLYSASTAINTVPTTQSGLPLRVEVDLTTGGTRQGNQSGRLVTCPVIPAAGLWTLGINEGYVPYNDLSKLLHVRMPDGTDLGGLGTDARVGDGTGGTTRRDADGRFYGTSTLPAETSSTVRTLYYDVGGIGSTYQMNVGPSLTFTVSGLSQNYTGYSYNSTTGIVQWTVTAGSQPRFGIAITLANIPSGGLKPSLVLVGAEASELNSVAVANRTAISKIIRVMDPVQANNDNDVRSTDLAYHYRTAAERLTGLSPGYSREGFAATCAAANVALWWNERLFDGPGLIADDAAFWSNSANYSLSKPIYIELGNELWNFGFAHFARIRLMAARAGLCVTGATPGTVITETIYEGPVTYGTATTRAYNNGDKVSCNGVIYQANANRAAGTTFNNTNFPVLYDYTATALGVQRYITQRAKATQAIWNPICDAAGRARPIMVLPGFNGGGFAHDQPSLDWDGGIDVFKRDACDGYWAADSNGSAALNDYAGYGQNALPLWQSPSYKDVLYTGTLAVGIAAYKANFIAAAQISVKAEATIIQTRCFQRAAYLVANGRDKDAVRQALYEASWHFIPYNYPEQAGGYSAGTVYGAGNFVLASDGAIYERNAVGAGSAGFNPVGDGGVHWTVKISAAVKAENRLQAAFSDIYNSSEFGDLMTLHMDEMRVRGHVSEFMHYQYGPTSAQTLNGTWAVMQSEADNALTGGSTNYRFKALKTYKDAYG